MAKQLQKADSAFSYIEMLLIILIMLIMIHVVSYHSFDTKKAAVAESNQEFLSVITYYQTLAMSSGQSITLSFLPGSEDVLIESQKLGIDTKYHLHNGYIYRGNSIYNSEITFRGDTINRGATITYFINQQRFELVFQLVRGRIRIESK
ncbi:hypothetical protein [Macrococcus hajekii]|nr:hypothetical protein [Macrococcus hajekii]